LGKTVQVVPHITSAIQDWVERVAHVPVDDSGEEPDVCIVEVNFRLLFDLLDSCISWVERLVILNRHRL
jgi:hypothetical protein